MFSLRAGAQDFGQVRAYHCSSVVQRAEGREARRISQGGNFVGEKLIGSPDCEMGCKL